MSFLGTRALVLVKNLGAMSRVVAPSWMVEVLEALNLLLGHFTLIQYVRPVNLEHGVFTEVLNFVYETNFSKPLQNLKLSLNQYEITKKLQKPKTI